MIETVEHFPARSNRPVIIVAWGSFLGLAVMAMDPFINFAITEVKWLYAAWPTAMTLTIPAWGWSAIISMEILALGTSLATLHEASHIIVHRLLGTPAARIHLQAQGINPIILVDGFESWPVKFLATAAPLATTLLPAFFGLVAAQGSVWHGLFAFVAVMAWGLCLSDVNVLLNYLRIPRDARIRVSEGGKLTEWVIANK